MSDTSDWQVDYRDPIVQKGNRSKRIEEQKRCPKCGWHGEVSPPRYKKNLFTGKERLHLACRRCHYHFSLPCLDDPDEKVLDKLEEDNIAKENKGILGYEQI